MSILNKQTGSVTLIASLVLGLVVFMMLFAIDLAHYYVVKTKLQVIVDNATDAGAGYVGDKIVEYAKPRMEAFENPPSSDPLFYLNDSERQLLVYGETTYEIKQIMLIAEQKNTQDISFAREINFTSQVPAKKISLSCVGVNSVKFPIKSTASTDINIIFKPLAVILRKNTLNVNAESVTTISLCPKNQS